MTDSDVAEPTVWTQLAIIGFLRVFDSSLWSPLPVFKLSYYQTDGGRLALLLTWCTCSIILWFILLFSISAEVDSAALWWRDSVLLKMNAVHSSSLPCLLLPAFLWIWFKKVCSLTSLKARVHLELFSSLSTFQEKSLVMSLLFFFFLMALAKIFSVFLSPVDHFITHILLALVTWEKQTNGAESIIRQQLHAMFFLSVNKNFILIFSVRTAHHVDTGPKVSPCFLLSIKHCQCTAHDGYHYLIIIWLIQIGLKNKAKMFKLWKKEKTNKYLAFSSCATVNETSLPLSDGRPDSCVTVSDCFCGKCSVP